MYFDRLNRVPRTILLIPIRFFNIIFIGFQGQERERERERERGGGELTIKIPGNVRLPS
jgi:hypothetical protein